MRKHVLETGSVLRKKAVDDRQKEELEILKRLNKQFQRLTQETNLSFGRVQHILKKDLHSFPYRVSVLHEIPLDNNSPHNITSLNIDRWIDL
jgi:uncharacterized lipoprotein YajG